MERELVRGNVVDIGTRIICLVPVCLEVCCVLDLYSSVAPSIDICWRIRDGIAHVTRVEIWDRRFNGLEVII